MPDLSEIMNKSVFDKEVVRTDTDNESIISHMIKDLTKGEAKVEKIWTKEEVNKFIENYNKE